MSKKYETFRKAISVQESTDAMFSGKWWFLSLPSLTAQNFKQAISRIVPEVCAALVDTTKRLHTRNTKRFYLCFMKEALKLDFHQNFNLNTTVTYMLILNCLNYSVISCILYIRPNTSWLVKYLPWENIEIKVGCTDWMKTDSPNNSLKFLYFNIFLRIGSGWWNIYHGKTLREKWILLTEWWQRRVLRTCRKRVLTMRIWRRRM
jgi:hypothetical protein